MSDTPPLNEDQAPKTRFVAWHPVSGDDRYEVRIAEGSVQPMSKAALRSMALELKKVGAIDVLHLLQWLEVPDAEEVAEAVENELKLAALAKVGRK